MSIFRKIAKWASVLFTLLVIVLFGAFYVLTEEENLRARVERDFNGYRLRVLGGVGPSLNGPSVVWNDLTLRDMQDRETLHIGKMMISPALPEFFGPEQIVKIRLKGISASGRMLGDLSAHVRKTPEGNIELAPLTGEISGGKAAGRILLDGRSFQPVIISFEVKGFDYSRLRQEMSGTLDVRADLTASPGSQWVQSLEGQVEIVGEKAVWPPDIDFWATDIVPRLLPFGGKVEETRLNCLVTRFNVNAGFAAMPAALIDSERVTITGSGRIDLAQGLMDMRFVPRPKNPTLLSLATPVRVSGPVGLPRIVPEAAGLARKVGELMLGSINPALLLVPLTSVGETGKNPCLAALEKAQ